MLDKHRNSSHEPMERPGNDTRLLHFAMLNDPHVQGPAKARQKKTYSGANERMRWFVQDIQKRQLDFLLGVGDQIHGESLAHLDLDHQYFMELLEPLTCPFFPLMGNHEVIQREGDPVYEKAFRDTFGNEKVNYTFRRGGILFVMLNNSGASGGALAPEVQEKRNAWLLNVLKTTRTEPKILCCHVPIFPAREERVLAESFGFKSYHARDEELSQMIVEFARDFIALLSGHLHLTSVTRHHGIWQIVPSGLAGYPHDYALFEVFGDRICVSMKSVPGELQTPDTNIHGKPRHPIDYKDADHLTHTSYLGGNENERIFELHLRNDST